MKLCHELFLHRECFCSRCFYSCSRCFYCPSLSELLGERQVKVHHVLLRGSVTIKWISFTMLLEISCEWQEGLISQSTREVESVHDPFTYYQPSEFRVRINFNFETGVRTYLGWFTYLLLEVTSTVFQERIWSVTVAVRAGRGKSDTTFFVGLMSVFVHHLDQAIACSK